MTRCSTVEHYDVGGKLCEYRVACSLQCIIIIIIIISSLPVREKCDERVGVTIVVWRVIRSARESLTENQLIALSNGREGRSLSLG